MNNANYKPVFMSAVVALCAAGMAGCGTSAKTLESGDDLAVQLTGTDDAVVVGRFKLIRNGEPVELGDGILANRATLHLHNAGNQSEIDARVGENGEFAWVIPPGRYRIANIEFCVRGETVSPSTKFEFSANGNDPVTYIGTITLETTFDSGYYGVDGFVDGYTVEDDCESDCAAMLSRLDLGNNVARVSLIEAAN